MTNKSRRRLATLLENMPEGHSYYNGYLRLDKEYPIDTVLSDLGDHSTEVDGHNVKMGSLRYQAFDKNIACVVCGTEGVYFRLEKHALHANIDNNTYHFNLYSIDDEGNEVLMTKDHILPKSKGGRNHISNLQTMCTTCNVEKGNKEGCNEDTDRNNSRRTYIQGPLGQILRVERA